MGLGKLASGRIDTVLGIDASTNTVAFCLYGEDGPIKWGEISFKGSNSFERLFDAGPKLRTVFKDFKYDAIVIEPIVYVNNRSTVINLAYAMGAILSSIPSAPIHEYNPLVWQKFIGNPPFTKAEKDSLKKKYADRSASWVKEQMRKQRKQRTMDWVKETFEIETDNDNIADAIAVAYTGWTKLKP